MKKNQYTTTISAPASKIFDVMLGLSDKKTYEAWTAEFNPTSNVTIFLALNPITAATLGVLFLGEGISIPFLWGLGCVIVGLWLSLKVKVQLGGKDVGFT
jgi:hypothetical protein